MSKKMIVIILAVLWVIVGGTVIYIFLDIDLYETHSCDLDIMSTSDIEEFNSTFTAFQGEIKGDSVRNLCYRLISNANTYRFEPDKIPMVSYYSNMASEDENYCFSNFFCEVEEESKTEDYIQYLKLIAKYIDLKHKYFVIMTENTNSTIHGITINYDKEDAVENFIINKESDEAQALKGLRRVDSRFIKSFNDESVVTFKFNENRIQDE